METQKPLEQETPETTPQEAPTATIPQPESTPAIDHDTLIVAGLIGHGTALDEPGDLQIFVQTHETSLLS